MKTGTCLIASAALLAAACTAKGGNQSGDTAAGPSQGGRPVAGALAFSASGCAATWDGQAVTADALSRKSNDAMMQAIRAAGGVDRLQIETMPTIRIEGPPSIDWSCAGPYVAALTDGGAPIVQLAVTGDAGPAAMLGLPIPNMPAPVAAIAIDGRGYRWNGEAIDSAALDLRLSRLGGPPDGAGDGQGPPSVSERPPPGEIRVEPAAGATFAALLAFSRTAARHHLVPDLAARPASLPAPSEGLVPPPR